MDIKRIHLEDLNDAIVEAERFLEKARKACIEIGAAQYSTTPTVHFAAAKRASMDLTRALADVRRNPYHRSK